MQTRVEIQKLTDSERLMLNALKQEQIDSLIIDGKEYTINEIEMI